MKPRSRAGAIQRQEQRLKRKVAAKVSQGRKPTGRVRAVERKEALVVYARPLATEVTRRVRDIQKMVRAIHNKVIHGGSREFVIPLGALASDNPPPPAPDGHYKVEQVRWNSEEELQEQFNGEADDGWEVVQILPAG